MFFFLLPEHFQCLARRQINLLLMRFAKICVCLLEPGIPPLSLGHLLSECYHFLVRFIRMDCFDFHHSPGEVQHLLLCCTHPLPCLLADLVCLNECRLATGKLSISYSCSGRCFRPILIDGMHLRNRTWDVPTACC